MNKREREKKFGFNATIELENVNSYIWQYRRTF